MNKLFYTYEIIDPRNNFTFYVGKGQKDRMHIHYKNAKNRNKMQNKHLYNKFKQLIDENIEPLYKKILESENEQKCFNKEIERIEEIGIDNLCNISLGGFGGDTISKNPNRKLIINNIRLAMSKREIKQKMIKNHSDVSGKNNPMHGRKHNFETIQKMRKSALGRRHTSETKNKLSKSQKRRFEKLEERIKISNQTTGIKNPRFCGITNEQLEKIIKANTILYNRKLKQIELNEITGITGFYSKYRKKYFGNMTNYLRDCENILIKKHLKENGCGKKRKII